MEEGGTSGELRQGSLYQKILSVLRQHLPTSRSPNFSHTQAPLAPENIAHWSVIALCALLPFFFVPAAWVSIGQAKILLVVALVIIGTIAWVLAALLKGSVRFPQSSLLFAAILVPLAYLVSAMATGASRLSFVGGSAQQDTVVSVLIWYALFVACVYAFGASADRLRTAAQALIFGGAVVVLLQLFHLLAPSFSFGGALATQVANVVGSWHDLAIFLGLLFFLTLALIPTFNAGNRGWKMFLAGIAIVSGALLVVANIPDVWLGIGAIAMLYGAYLTYNARRSPEGVKDAFMRRAFWWFVIGVVAAGLFFGGAWFQRALPSFLQVTQFEVRPSWQGTYAIGTQVFTQPNSILFGSGPNTFLREWTRHKPLTVNTTEFWNFDFYSGVGFIPTSFVTVGILGVIAWAAICLALLWSAWKVVRARAESSGSAALHALFVASALYLTAFHVLYTPGPVLSALTFIFFGLVVSAELIVGATRGRGWSLSLDSWKGHVGVPVLIIFAILVSFGGVQASRATFSDMFVNRAAVVYNTTGDITRATTQTGLALAISPNNDRAHRAAVELGILQLGRLVASGGEDDAARANLQNTLTATINHGLEAVSIGSTDYQNWLSLARLYGELAGAGVEGAEQAAREAYEEAHRTNPTNPLPPLGLAQLDLAAGNEEGARAYLVETLEIKPNFALALFLLSQIDARAGDLEAARESAEAVVILAQEDSLGWYNLGTIYYANEDFERAALAFENAAALQNDYANALFLLSASYASLERYEEAALVLRRVAELNPEESSLPPMIETLEAGENPFEN